MNPEDFTFMGECKLMGYGESDSSGAWVKLQIEPEDLARFRGLRGEIFECALKQLDNSGQAVKPKINLRLTAIELCKNRYFQDYISARLLTLHRRLGVVANEDNAAKYLREWCGIKHRSELDKNASAARKFAELRTDYTQWKREQAYVIE